MYCTKLLLKLIKFRIKFFLISPFISELHIIIKNIFRCTCALAPPGGLASVHYFMVIESLKLASFLYVCIFKLVTEVNCNL